MLRGDLNAVRTHSPQLPRDIWRTVRPLESVVDSVLTPFLFDCTGVAKPLFNGEMELRAERLRKLCERLRANRREAITAGYNKGDGEGGSTRVMV